jgi:predicted ester cyclase
MATDTTTEGRAEAVRDYFEGIWQDGEFDTATGTHEGEFRGIPPTGSEIAIAGIGVFRLADGQIVESWYLGDFLGLLQQVGAVDMPD